MTLEELLSRLDNVKSAGEDSYTACCPAHDDRDPSLSVKREEDGRILLHCHAGCEFEEVCEALGVAAKDLAPADGRQEPPRRPEGGKRGKLHETVNDAAKAAALGLKRKHKRLYRTVATYSYRDRDGKLVAAVLRLENPENGPPSKEYRPIHKDGAGWRIGDPPGGFPLYRLPELLASEGPVFVCEGEKASDALATVGLTATTSAHGAGAARKADWSALAGRTVIFVPDNDEAGEKYAQEAAGRLRGLDPAPDVRLLKLPDLPDKGDAVEYVDGLRDKGKTDAEIGAELEALASKTPVYGPPAEGDDQGEGLPKVFLPGGARNVRITQSAERLGELLDKRENMFCFCREMVQVCKSPEGTAVIQPVKAAALASELETVADLRTTVAGRNGAIKEVRRNCSKSDAELIMSSVPFLDRLPPLRLLTPRPVFVEHEGELIVIRGYHRPTGIYATGGAAEDVPLEEAVRLLSEVLDDFLFVTESDRSRAIAGLIAPALVHGGLLGGRAPLEMGEADDSQTGKGYRVKLAASVYNAVPLTITQREGRGTGSLEESFSAALLEGAAFISLDNLRGELDSPALESALTEDYFLARAPYRKPTKVDMRRVVVMATSNAAKLTTDMANRMSLVRLRKQPEGHVFRTFQGGADVLGHVRMNQGRYLGAVFAVVREWWRQGKPETDEVRHDFRPWARTLDWIVQNLFECAPLCDGLQQAKKRTTTPHLNWLRDVALAVRDEGCLGTQLRVNDIVDIAYRHGVEVPGMGEKDSLDDDDVARKAFMAVGRRLATCFGGSSRPGSGGDEIAACEVDGYEAQRCVRYDSAHRREIRSYRFTDAEAAMGAAA